MALCTGSYNHAGSAMSSILLGLTYFLNIHQLFYFILVQVSILCTYIHEYNYNTYELKDIETQESCMYVCIYSVLYFQDLAFYNYHANVRAIK